MRSKRGRPTTTPQIKSWLTQDIETEEPAPWTRMHITKTAFRPPTFFDYDIAEEHSTFDAETDEIKKAFRRKTIAEKKLKTRRDIQFWDIVNRIETNDPPEESENTANEGEDEAEDAPEDIRTKYMKNRRSPISSIEPSDIEKFSDSVQEILLARRAEILDQPTYQAQLYLVLEITNHEEIPAIARLFKVKRQTIRNHARRKKLTKKPVGRPAMLTGTEMVILKNQICLLFYEKNVPNIPTLIHFIAERFKKDVSSDTLLHIIARNKLGKTCEGQPMEKTRCEADLQEIVDFYDNLGTFFEKNPVPDAFCFNVDESGFQPWADRTSDLVVIPLEANDKDVVFPVDRTRKRSSLVAAIAADGTYLAPLIIIPRKTIEKEMLACGYRAENNVFIVSQESGFITGLIWDFWVETIFIPEIRRRRLQHGYSGEIVLMLDGCTAHSTDFFLDECVYHGVTIFELPPNASDQVQALDLGMFGIQKNGTRNIKPAARFSEQSKEIIKICSSWTRIATPTNITAAFAEAGLTKVQFEGDPRFYMRACIKHAHQVRGIDHESIDYQDAKAQIKVQAF